MIFKEKLTWGNKYIQLSWVNLSVILDIELFLDFHWLASHLGPHRRHSCRIDVYPVFEPSQFDYISLVLAPYVLKTEIVAQSWKAYGCASQRNLTANHWHLFFPVHSKEDPQQDCPFGHPWRVFQQFKICLYLLALLRRQLSRVFAVKQGILLCFQDRDILHN